jgi:hypothetical protein
MARRFQKLRIIDNEAKVAGLSTPGLVAYRPVSARIEWRTSSALSDSGSSSFPRKDF